MVQPAILTVLAEGPLHGYRLIERLSRLRLWGGVRPDAAGVYRALRVMQDRGVVASSWDAPEAGPAKRLFAMTAEGRRCLTRWADTLDAYRDGIAELLVMVQTAARPRRRGRACSCKKDRRPQGSVSR
jgi:DNA-binding PadR family transcriptional regulator